MSTGNANGTTIHAPTTQRSLDSLMPKDGPDERAYSSGSDDGNYMHYIEGLKSEGDTEDDNNWLISQTLNTDGTPKRPMNAFMIFARRRRPQVSAENQSMRTGEVSKILSKEWGTMPAGQKQFYQDQARQLKETFNSKYPDYVYRRRPNHTRRHRRKTESRSGNTGISESLDDNGFESPDSPPDVEDTRSSEKGRENHHYVTARAFSNGEQEKFYISSPYSYSIPDPSHHANEQQLTYPPTNPSDEHYLSPSPASSPNQTTPPMQYPLPIQNHAQVQSPPLYRNRSMDHETWNMTSNSHQASWLGNGPDRTFPVLPGQKVQQSLHGWHRAESVSPSVEAASPIPSEHSFLQQTLNSPFFPDSTHQPFSPVNVSLTANGGESQFTHHGLHISGANGSNSCDAGSARNTLHILTRGTSGPTIPSISSYSHPNHSGSDGTKIYW